MYLFFLIFETLFNLVMRFREPDIQAAAAVTRKIDENCMGGRTSRAGRDDK